MSVPVALSPEKADSHAHFVPRWPSAAAFASAFYEDNSGLGLVTTIVVPVLHGGPKAELGGVRVPGGDGVAAHRPELGGRRRRVLPAVVAVGRAAAVGAVDLRARRGAGVGPRRHREGPRGTAKGCAGLRGSPGLKSLL